MKYRHNFQTWISHENTNRIIKKKLSIVLTYTERLTFVFFQKNHENLFNEIKTVLSVSRSLQLTTFQTWISHENTNRIIQKKAAYSVYVYGALDVRLFPNKSLIVDLKNIEIWISYGLKGIEEDEPVFLKLKYIYEVNGEVYLHACFLNIINFNTNYNVYKVEKNDNLSELRRCDTHAITQNWVPVFLLQL